jgi:UDPglucose 6-dehydrogenase
MEKTIGFIGQGWIGKNLADNFERRGYKTVRYAKEKPYDANLEKLKNADIIFIAVPTPTTPEGFDDSILRSAIKLAKPGQTVVIKSTVLPGTTDSIADENPGVFIMHSPEFLREMSVKKDIEKPERNIIGIPTRYKDDPEWRKRAEEVLAVIPNAPYEVICSAPEAELTKYGGNNFFYVKVVYMNMLYELAQHHGASWDVVANNMIADSRIGASHMQPVHQIAHLDNGVPGRGAGGHCFLKDFAALRFHYEEKFPDHSHMHSLLRSFEATNNYLLRSTNKDKELLLGVYGEDVLCVCKITDKSSVCVCGVNKS